MHGEPDEVPKDPKAVARAAFIAGAIYAVLFGFCTCQVCDRLLFLHIINEELMISVFT